MRILSHRSEVQKNLRITEMLQNHAAKNGQPKIAEKYRKKAEALRNGLNRSLGWISKHPESY